MADPARDWLEASASALAEALALRLHGRAGSVFRAQGEDACRQLGVDLIAALRQDLTTGKDGAARKAMSAAIEGLVPKGLGFADLRHLTGSLRTVVLASLTADPAAQAEAGRRIDDWLYQCLAAGTMLFVSVRERVHQEQTVALEVRQLESQLTELRTAYAEQARLLDLIRQASTPMAPVYEGILVVPLVGVLDNFRAEVFTEKLLTEVVGSKTRIVILDVSGVPVFDTEAAQAVLRTASAVRLLGTRLILVGLSPAMAGTIADLGIDLSGIVTLGNLQAGLARALAMRQLRIAPIDAK